MENASKALLIAGQVLIAILLLTLLSYLFTKMHENTVAIQEKMNLNEKMEFNQQFLVYDGIQDRVIGKTDDGEDIYGALTAQDVASIINLAKSNNINPKFPTIIQVIYNGVDLAKTKDLYEWLEEKIQTNEKYGCNVHINSSTQLVDVINILNKP